MPQERAHHAHGAERDVSAILQEVAETYSHDEIALSLRKIHLVYEGMQDNEGTVVVPSAYSEASRSIRTRTPRRLKETPQLSYT